MVFAIEELVILCFMSLFSCLGGRIYRKREQAIIAERNGNKFDGIKQGDYDYIWFDFACIERALILRQKDKYVLYVHEYDEHTGKWKRVNQMDEYDNLEQLKEALFFEFDFHCQENALLDEYGIWR